MVVVDSKEVVLEGATYLAYLKEVPVRLESCGKTEKTVIRAFIRKVEK